jgi:hypothetical protein
MVPGYDIIPELLGTAVISEAPTAPCRFEVAVLHGQVCEATNSFSSILIRFTPTMSADLVGVAGRVMVGSVGAVSEPFIFADALVSKKFNQLSGGEAFEVRNLDIIVQLDVRVPYEVNLRVDGIKNPSLAGQAYWTITTYTLVVLQVATNSKPAKYRYDRRDEKLDLAQLVVLGYIKTLESSRVNPIYYSAMAATITFELKPQFAWAFGDIVVMTRPPGFSMLDGTLLTFRDFRVGENGLDSWRRFSKEIEDQSAYYMVLAGGVEKDQTVTFALKANLPDIPYQNKNWNFKTYKILEQRDIDGEILDDKQVPYPWLNQIITENAAGSSQRPLVLYGSNDGAFMGFSLVGKIPFQVLPARKTPGASIKLTINFKLDAPVEAKLNCLLVVTGPVGYLFRDSCLAKGSPQFSKCTGYRNTATLTTVKKTLSGTDIPVHLSVTNPGETPLANTWSLALFKDESTAHVNWSQKWGYEISAMKVYYKGNNQLQSTSTGYFTFTPMSQSPSAVVNFYFYPPANMGYKLTCENVQPLAFAEVASCEALGRDEPLMLRIDNATIVAEMRYTIGIGVQNPGGRPAPEDNLWGLLLKDHMKQTFDGNLRIQGLELKSVPMECEALGWTTAEPRTLAVITIQLMVNYPIQPGLVKTIEIVAPQGVMYNENPSSVKVAPKPLPLRSAQPTQVMGDLLKFNLDLTQVIKPNRYNIRFEVSNPGTPPSDNTWQLRVMKDIEMEFSHVFAGYVEKQTSPFEVMTNMGSVGGAQRVTTRAASAGVVVVGSVVVAAAAL